MAWESVRNCGKIKEGFKKIPLTNGKIKTGEFFGATLMEFAKVSTRAYDSVGDISFAYKERQFSSVFLPAFYNLGYGVIQEIPTRRKERGEECSHGWLDYWVQKDENCVYLIEMKHGWQHLDGDITQGSIGKILSSVNQLKCIRKKEVEKLSCLENTFKVSLLVFPVYRNIPKNLEISEDEEFPTSTDELDEMLDKITVAMPDVVSWLGVWSLPERMQYAFRSNEVKGLRSFPGVVLIATIVK